MTDLKEVRKWAAEMERSSEVLLLASGGADKSMMESASCARAYSCANSRVAGLLAQSANEIEQLRAQLAAANAQRDELKCELEQLEIYLRCRGASGETVLDRVKRMERDGTAAESFWQKAQARADMLQQQLDQCAREREELAKSYRETIDDRDELLRIINDAFLSLHIPGSTKAFDGRNLVVHSKDSAEVAMVLRAERDEARRERDDALANTSLPGYCRLVEERDAARRDLASLMAAAKSLTDDPNACWEDFLAAVDAIARAQSGQPAQGDGAASGGGAS